MAATVSAVPAVLDYLVSSWTQALPPNDRLTVTDGQPLDLTDDVVCVGFTGQPGEASVISTRTREHLSVDPDREQFDVISMVSTWRGREQNAKSVRDAMYVLVNTIADDVARDQTLGGLVMRAQMTTGEVAQWQTDDGATAVLRITVHCDGFTRRP